MSTHLDTRPVTAESNIRTPRMIHRFHRLCNGADLGPGSVAICGTVKQSPFSGAFMNRQPDCVVCAEMRARQHCGHCGGVVK